MGDSIRAQIEAIKRKELAKLKRVTLELAKQAEADLEEAHKTIIDNFYSSYSPGQYNRTGNLENSGVPIAPTAIGEGHEAGITVGAFAMGSVYKTSQDHVFDLMWNQGIRGLPESGSRVIDHSWYYANRYYNYGEYPRVWTNDYFMRFTARGTANGYTATGSSPHAVMTEIVKNWDKVSGTALAAALLSGN